MADIILDVNAFRIFIDKEFSGKFIDKVKDKCHHIYVLRNTLDQVARIFKFLPLQLLTGPFKKLGSAKYHEEPKSNIEREKLPPRIEEELEKYHADHYDKALARLALRRRKKGQEVYLVSSDPCFLNNRKLFKNYGIEVVDWRGLIASLDP
jgi:hypothetical protein